MGSDALVRGPHAFREWTCDLGLLVTCHYVSFLDADRRSRMLSLDDWNLAFFGGRSGMHAGGYQKGVCYAAYILANACLSLSKAQTPFVLVPGILT